MDIRKLKIIPKLKELIASAACIADSAPKPGAKYDWYYRFHAEAVIENEPCDIWFTLGASKLRRQRTIGSTRSARSKQ